MDEKYKNLLEQRAKYRDSGRELKTPVESFKEGYDEAGLKEAALRSLSSISEPIDSLVGVPYRTLVDELARVSGKDSDASEYGQALLKSIKSVGTDPRNAPTGSDIAEKMFRDPEDVTARTLASTLYDTQDFSNLAGGAGLLGKAAKEGGILAGTIKKVGGVDSALRPIKGSGGKEVQKLLSGEERIKKLEEILGRDIDRPLTKNPTTNIERTGQLAGDKIIQKATPIRQTELGAIRYGELDKQLRKTEDPKTKMEILQKLSELTPSQEK